MRHNASEILRLHKPGKVLLTAARQKELKQEAKHKALEKVEKGNLHTNFIKKLEEHKGERTKFR